MEKYLSKLNANVYFGLVIFLSAFLLFQVQPMISKYILPWFGGATTVWTTAQVFFQGMLVAGYGYAHLLSRAKLARQGQIHLVVLAGAGLWLALTGLLWGVPLLPDASWKPEGGGYPGWQVLAVLLVGVGGPYFVLSSTSSLLQAWYGRLQGGRSPYGFYALSNAASLLALLSYPVLFEPNLALRGQAGGWALGFGAYLALLAGIVVQALRGKAPAEQKERRQGDKSQAGAVKPGWGKILSWVGLAACGSTMSLAVTNQITQDVASVPFLWVLPLSLYLLTYVLGFIERVARQKGLMVLMMLLALGAGLLLISPPATMPLGVQIAVNCFVLFAVCLFCHSELYRSRPHPRFLTSFYLMVSIGGALGGVLVSLVAPVLFRGFWEFPLALLICADLARQMAFADSNSRLFRFRHLVTLVVLGLAVGIVLVPLKAYSDSYLVKRNFYGLLRVRQVDYDGVPAYNLVNGTITHGLQAMEGENRDRPTSYFTESSGAALAIRHHPARVRGQALRIGIIGLGVGTLAYYGQDGDTVRFYEINPQVIETAWDDRYFTYLRDAKAPVEIVEGDARLSLEREMAESGSQQYDVFIIDAFSGDSIPAHLLSIEAVQLYFSHLKPGGVIVFHISNKYLDLEPVLWRAQQELKVAGTYIHGKALAGDPLSFDSFWVMLARDEAFFSNPALAAVKRDLKPDDRVRTWTDDYSNLFQVLK